jgi:Cu2+-exporting ATPase
VVAFAASAWSTWTGRGEVYYDSVTMFVALLLAARYFELRSRQRAAAVVESLARSVPPTAERLVEYPHSLATETVAASALVPGGLTLVRPGARVPADGVVVDGVSHADEALVTGESRPVPKQAGAEVMAGSVNRESQLIVRVTRIAAESRVSQILRLVERALHERPSIGRAADRVAAWSVAGILVAAALAGGYWWLNDPARALPVVVAVLVVSCPCALSLAVPTALASATASLARRGILVTRADAIEAMARATDVAFDKTGTLTDGHFALVGVFPHRALDREACVALAAALEGGSEHPIATALRGASRAAAPAASGLRSVSGCGVEGTIGGRRYRIGSPGWVARLHAEPLPIESRLLAAHVSPVALADEEGWIAWFTFADRLRPAAAATVSALREAGTRVHLLSGDRPATVAHCGALLEVDSAAGGLEPEGKLGWLREQQQRGARVMMVGDGVNDAPVLAGAQVSAAMACGTPLALISADVVLLRDDIAAVGVAMRESRRALRIMWQNFGWAILYNAIAIPAAAAGAVTPLAAGIGMSLSSLLVVANSLRLATRRRVRADPIAVRVAAAAAA